MKHSLALALSVLFMPAWVTAQTPAPAPARVRTPIFVTADQVQATKILPAPAANGSWQSLAELAELHRIQETRTAERASQAQADDREESMFLFSALLGPKFNKESLPKTALLSDHVKNDESIVVNPGKNFFKRPRPYLLDTTLKPICKTARNAEDYSYPSGHGTTGYLEALTLAQILPERREEILARADDYAYSREVCGEHYPSDEQASKVIAYAMFGVMFNHPQYQAELAAATVELRSALDLPPLDSTSSGSR